MAESRFSPEQEKEERGVIWVYNWLFWSPFITVPFMVVIILITNWRASNLGWAIKVSVPAIAHIVLLIAITSSNQYVKRHGQQAAILVGARMVSTILLIGFTRADSVFLWILVNGFMWLRGTTWGRSQVKRGDCWLMRYLTETVDLPRPWAQDKGVVSPEPAPASTAIGITRPPAHEDINLSDGDLVNGKKEQAIEHFLQMFHEGPAEMRQKAVDELRKLGEIEKF
jgi:hypothetical protein